MKRRIIQALMLCGTISGCLNIDGGPETGGPRPNYGQSQGPPTVPGVQGPYGAKVPMAAPYKYSPPGNPYAAARMMSSNVPLNMVQQHPGGMPMGGPPGSRMPNPMMPPGGMLAPPGMPPIPGMGGGPNLMQTAMQGPMQGPGMMNANMPPNAKSPDGVTPAQFSASSPVGSMFPAQRTQVFISQPANMKVYWFTQGSDGKPNYSTTPLETPGRYNFAQAAIYRLKLTHIPGRPALELYPTLEVVPTSPKTNEFLAHNSVPLEFTDEDFKQVVDRNYLVKVIYLPDPQFQDGAGAGPDSIVSTRLEPGQDPIQEALRRGSILLVVRMGNIDQGLQHSPAMGAPAPGGAPAQIKPPGQGVPPLFQVPFPIPAIPPGGVALPPNTLPPIPGGAGAVMPKVDATLEKKDGEAIKPETPVVPPLPLKKEVEAIKPLTPDLPAVPMKKEADVTKPAIAPLPPLPALPAPPGLKPDAGKPVEPVATPKVEIKGAVPELTLPSLPVLPTNAGKQVTPAPKSEVKTPDVPPITLPTIPPANLTPAARPDLPFIPMITPSADKN